MESSKSEPSRKYQRDFLLQLRMHPLSLQKPNNLPNNEIIKDRLYIDHCIGDSHINDFQPSYFSNCSPTSSMSAEYLKKMFQHFCHPGYFPRNCSYYSSGQKCNSALPLSKYRSSFNHSLLNSSHKHLLRTIPAFKNDMTADDFFENLAEMQTAPWIKEFPVYSPSESTWNYNQKNSGSSSTCSSNKENSVCYPKCKKKLSIIDPKTGKDILDGICENPTSQNHIASENNIEEETKSLSEAVESEGIHNQSDISYLKNVENEYSITSEEDIEYLATASKSTENSTGLSLSHDSSDEDFLKEYSIHSVSFDQNSANMKHVESNSNKKKDLFGNQRLIDSCQNKEKFHSTQTNLKEENSLGSVDALNKLENNLSKNMKDDQTSPIISQNTDVSNKDMNGSIIEQEDNESDLKEKVSMLRDKIYTMKQEQQKMAILQSFLRFKKHQLDESFRSLDDKKIDVVNWEYNLYNKAKKLHEREYWLEAKNKNLQKKEKQLEDKEKLLNLREKEIENKYSILKKEIQDVGMLKENGVVKNNTALKVESDRENNKECTSKRKVNNLKFITGKVHHEKNDKTYKLPVENGRNTTPLKDYASGDICEIKTNLQTVNEPEVKSSFSKVKSTYGTKVINSEARKYFTEHIKYRLNKKEKKVLENTDHVESTAK